MPGLEVRKLRRCTREDLASVFHTPLLCLSSVTRLDVGRHEPQLSLSRKRHLTSNLILPSLRAIVNESSRLPSTYLLLYSSLPLNLKPGVNVWASIARWGTIDENSLKHRVGSLGRSGALTPAGPCLDLPPEGPRMSRNQRAHPMKLRT